MGRRGEEGRGAALWLEPDAETRAVEADGMALSKQGAAIVSGQEVTPQRRR